jgi:hypothetical protein
LYRNIVNKKYFKEIIENNLKNNFITNLNISNNEILNKKYLTRKVNDKNYISKFMNFSILGFDKKVFK